MLKIYGKYDIMDMIKVISSRLLQLCAAKNITVNKLANISAVPPTTLKNIIYGLSKNPKIVTVKMLCDGLDITLAEFFDIPEFNRSTKCEKSTKIIPKSKKGLAVNTVTAVKYRILELCETNNVAIYKLTNITSVPTGTVNNILYGKSKNPKLSTIKMLCDGLGITLTEFFDTDYFNNLEQEVK